MVSASNATLASCSLCSSWLNSRDSRLRGIGTTTKFTKGTEMQVCAHSFSDREYARIFANRLSVADGEKPLISAGARRSFSGLQNGFTTEAAFRGGLKIGGTLKQCFRAEPSVVDFSGIQFAIEALGISQEWFDDVDVDRLVSDDVIDSDGEFSHEESPVFVSDFSMDGRITLQLLEGSVEAKDEIVSEAIFLRLIPGKNRFDFALSLRPDNDLKGHLTAGT